MLNTIFGELLTYINGKQVEHTYSALPLKVKHFEVDARYRVEVVAPSTSELFTFSVTVDTSKMEGYTAGPDAGEDLAMITFDKEATRLSVGMDDRGWAITYPSQTIQAVSTEELGDKCVVVLYVAWVTKTKEEIRWSVDTWFLADPSLGWEKE